ncbi:MAG: sialidase family protein [Verrucomicrobiota bacterium]
MTLPFLVRCVVLGLSALSFSLARGSDGFETGLVIASDGAEFDRNGIPCVARLANGHLMAVWTTSAKGSQTGHLYFSLSADAGSTWSKPRLLLKDAERKDGDPNIVIDGPRVFVYSTRVSVPNAISKSSVFALSSDDFGATWSAPRELAMPRQYVVGKQHKGLKLSNGTFLMGISWDNWPERGFTAKAEGEMDLSSGVLLSKDALNWTLHGELHTYLEKSTPSSINGLCEPAVVEVTQGEILMLLRSGSSRHYESRSRDAGLTWSKPEPSALVGHNTPTSLWRLEQSPHAIVAAWNNHPINRYPLSVALSPDGGRTWSPPRIVARASSDAAVGSPAVTKDKVGQVSYPSLTQTRGGRVFLVWQSFQARGGRDIRWARFPAAWITAAEKP